MLKSKTQSAFLEDQCRNGMSTNTGVLHCDNKVCDHSNYFKNMYLTKIKFKITFCKYIAVKIKDLL